MSTSTEITVPLSDLALVLGLPYPPVDYGEPNERGAFPNAKCRVCHKPAGAHYCAPTESARLRLEALVTSALA